MALCSQNLLVFAALHLGFFPSIDWVVIFLARLSVTSGPSRHRF